MFIRGITEILWFMILIQRAFCTASPLSASDNQVSEAHTSDATYWRKKWTDIGNLVAQYWWIILIVAILCCFLLFVAACHFCRSLRKRKHKSAALQTSVFRARKTKLNFPSISNVTTEEIETERRMKTRGKVNIVILPKDQMERDGSYSESIPEIMLRTRT